MLEGAAPELTLSLLTPCQVATGGPTAIALARRVLPAPDSATGRARLTCDFAGMAPQIAVDGIELTDPGLRRIWGERLFRIRWILADPPVRGRWQLRFEPA